MVTILRTELYKGGHTGHKQWSRDHSLFRIRFVVIVAPFHKGRDSIGAHIPVLVTGNIFLQFFPIPQPAWLYWYPPCVQGHGPKAVSCEVHILLFGELDLVFLVGAGRLRCPACTGFLGLLGRTPSHTHPLCTPCALLRTKGFWGASGEATARCVNLYAAMVLAC